MLEGDPISVEITPKTLSVGLIGHPVGHSLSPVLHNQLYQCLGLDMIYMAFDVHPCNVRKAVEGFQALGFVGFNVTIPHKEQVFALLDEIDPVAASIGAVNTVKIEKGRCKGYNTDGQGFIDSLLRQGVSIKGQNVVILGAGGSARAIGIRIAAMGPASIKILNRTKERTIVLCRTINDYAGHEIAKVAQEFPANADICINTTSLGMWPQVVGDPLEGIPLRKEMIVCDIVYNPRTTAMLRRASGAGCKTVEGIGMLVGQALQAVRIWTGSDLPDNAWEILLLTAKDIMP